MLGSPNVKLQMSRSLEYGGRDLEATCFALNYHRWVFDIFKPYLGTRVVEVGAGTGSFSSLLIPHRVESLSLIEPSHYMYELLMVRLAIEASNSHSDLQ